MSFDPRMALKLARLAELAYVQDEQQVAIKSDQLGLRMLKWSWQDQGNTHAGLWLGRDAVYVAFRGSNDQADWRENFQFGSLPHGWGRVHGGFARALERVVYEMLACIAKTSAARAKPVWLTGHSLGGALAVLMASKCHMAGLPLGGLYTFGAPQTGDRSFVRAFNRAFADQSWRLVNEGDFVPRLLAPRYQHVNALVMVDDNLKVVKRCPPGQRKACRMNRKKAQSLPPHAIAEYRRRLEDRAKA
ncbi:MAG: alpha/beta fold hydrolase [Kiritimatiellia bacterium]